MATFKRTSPFDDVIDPSGTITQICPPQGRRGYTLDQIQATVGGYFEVIHTPIKRMVILANEEGAINGLPVNLTASQLAGQIIRGTVLVTTPDRI